MKKSSIICMLLLTANWQSTSTDSMVATAFKLEQAQMQQLHSSMRDDDDEEQPAAKKVDEVDQLM